MQVVVVVVVAAAGLFSLVFQVTIVQNLGCTFHISLHLDKSSCTEEIRCNTWMQWKNRKKEKKV